MSGIKNIDKAAVLTLKEQVGYQPGQVVSKTLAQNDALSVTLFAFDKNEEISTHESGGDAFVTCLDGVGRITIDGVDYELMRASPSSCPSVIRTPFSARSNSKCFWSSFSEHRHQIVAKRGPEGPRFVLSDRI